MPRWGATSCAPRKEWSGTVESEGNGAVEPECKSAAGKKSFADLAAMAAGKESIADLVAAADVAPESESMSWGIWGL